MNLLTKANIPWSQICVILTVSLLPLINGIQFTWTSPYIPVLISKDSPVPMTLEEASYLTVIPPIMTLISSPLCAWLLNTIGRKPTMLLLTIPQLTSWVLIFFANSRTMLYIARAISGFADGATFTIVPIYVGEVLEPRVRGALGSLISFAIYFGQFFINTIGSYTSMQVSAVVCGILPILFFFVFLLMPETPYYLLMRNKQEKARNALKQLRNAEDVDEEVIKLSADVQRQLSESSTVLDLFKIESNRKALFVGLGLRVAHQLSGISAFSVYTQYLFEKAGSSISKSVSAMIFTALQTFFVLFAPLLVDRFGRRPLMIFSCIGCAILLSIETIYFYLGEYTRVDVSALNWVPITGMALYIFVFCVGFGIVPTLMLSELFSASIKGKAMCINSVCFSLGISITSKIFQIMADSWGLFAPFCLFAICCVFSTFFSYYCVPETKGKTLEQIQQNLKSKGNAKI